MTDSFIQLTTDGAGKKLDTVIVNLGVGSTELHREKMIVSDPSSSGGYANVTSSQGLQVQATGPVTVSGTVTVVSASSGLVQISGTPVVAISSSALAPVNIVTSSGAYVPTTTGAGLLVSSTQTHPVTQSGTWNVVSASSGLVQISGIPVVAVSSSAIAPVNLVTSSGAYVPVSTSSGLLVNISTGNIVTVLSASSGNTPTVVSASSGLIQMLGNVTTSTPEYSPGLQLVTMTTDGKVRVSSTSGGTGSTDVNVVGSTGQQVVVTSSGAMLVSATLSGTASTSINILGTQNAMVSVATSGTFAGALVVFSTAGSGSGSSQINVIGTSSAVAPATSSGGLLVTAIASTVWTVTATAATNPWSSAPSFNIPMVSASSGFVQVYTSTTQGIQINAPTSDVFSSGSVTASSQTNAFSVPAGFSQASIQFFGSSWSGTVFIEQTVDGTNWDSIPVLKDGLDLVNSITTGGVYSFPIGSIQQFRIHSSTNSGTLGFAVDRSLGQQTYRLASPLPTSTSLIGLVQSTQGTNPWSSAPGFNMPVVSVSSGLVQISGTATIVSASSGLVQISGTPTVLSASSGLVQISGTVGLSTAASGNLVAIVTTSAGSLVATTSQGLQVQQSTSKIVPVLQASSGVTSIDQVFATTSKTPSVVTVTTINKLSSSPSELMWLYVSQSCSTGGATYLRVYDATTSSVTMNSSVKWIIPVPLSSLSSVAAPTTPGYQLWPPGMHFTSGISVDAVAITTSTAAVTVANIFVTALII